VRYTFLFPPVQLFSNDVSGKEGQPGLSVEKSRLLRPAGNAKKRETDSRLLLYAGKKRSGRFSFPNIGKFCAATRAAGHKVL
jgi:hypothetical protein